MDTLRSTTYATHNAWKITVCHWSVEESASSFVTLPAASGTMPVVGHHLALLRPDSNQTLTLVCIALNVAAMEAPLSGSLLLPKCPQQTIVSKQHIC